MTEGIEQKRVERIAEIEKEMQAPNFWSDKRKAQELIKELGELKESKLGKGKYDTGDAIITIFSGAGGDDAEDFSSMLFRMYERYVSRAGLSLFVLHKNENDHGGFRNFTFEVSGKNAYGTLKYESGVHRLVRISPFNAKKLRHTSFSLVEVVPKLSKQEKFEIPESEITIEFARSSGPGGQNVNKRETAVRIVHIPTKISVHIDSERSQERNKEKALEILSGKLYKLQEENREKEELGMHISKTTDIEWGNQIRSYVLHPYKMVKDHRTGVETSDVEGVLERGEIEEFLEAERNL
ncbi:PCRF domain-containing protein [bacterium]|nr:PCRF domain-containing protein [bacterium]